MLRLDLGALSREGTVDVEADVAPDDELWKQSELSWLDDVQVRLRATFAGTGEIVARGKVRGTLGNECRRCLKPVRTGFEDALTLVFVSDDPRTTGETEPGDEGTYAFDANSGDLDLGRAVREEVVLAVNPYVVCDPGCRGLCAECGTNLNEDSCDCTRDEADPRWAALRELKDE